ncbi:MAG: metallophosphoesterase [Xanthomonadales bacterium]|nr:metallophosphoesterase [Xanthomonadales bacterium]
MPATAPAGDGITFIFTSDPQFCADSVDRISSCRRWGRKDVSVDWQIAGINRITEGRWPRRWQSRMGGDGAFDTPLGIVLGGDLTESAGGFRGRNGGGGQWRLYTTMYEHERADAVRFPVYVGLGNHDLEIEPRDRRLPRDLYRDRMWNYVAQRHAGSDAPVPVESFDPDSHSYSWNWGGVHLVQLHRFAGDTRHDLPSSLPWLQRDLERHASDGRPVVLFQHYGFESGNSIGRNDRSRSKWTPTEMDRFAEAIRDYNVIGLFHGHDHWSQPPYRWRGYDVFSPGAAHFGQFAVVHIDHQTMDVVYAEVTNRSGDLRLVSGSSFSKPVRWPPRLVKRAAPDPATSEPGSE